MNRYRVLGVNDDKDFCECCGKQGLKRVVWVEDRETSVIKHFGTTCAESPAKGFGLAKEIKSAIREYDLQMQSLYKAAHRLYRAAGGPSAPDGTGHGVRYTDEALLDSCIKQAKAERDAFYAGFKVIAVTK